MKKIITKIGLRGIAFFWLLISYQAVFAEYVIPISKDDQTKSGTDFSTTALNILQKDILPFIEIGAAAMLIFVFLGGLWKGFDEYQRERDLAPLKKAIAAGVTLIVVGGAALYILDCIRTFNF